MPMADFKSALSGSGMAIPENIELRKQRMKDGGLGIMRTKWNFARFLQESKDKKSYHP